VYYQPMTESPVRISRGQIVTTLIGIALIVDAALHRNPAAWHPGPNPEFSRPLDRIGYALSIVLPIVAAVWLSEPIAKLIKKAGWSQEFQASWIRAGAWTLLGALMLAALLNHLT
jgi:hypothetical protein